MTSIPPNGDGPPAPDLPDPAAPSRVSVAPPGMEEAAPAAPRPPAPRGSAAWKPWTAAGVLLAWFSMTIALVISMTIVAAVVGVARDDPPPVVNIVGTFAQDLLMIASALIFATMAGRPRGADFGLLRTPLGKAIGAMIAAWVGFIGFSLLWKWLISLDEPQTLPDQLGIQGSTLNLVLSVVIITMLAPVCEEMLFRGYVFGALRNGLSALPAAIITGLLFGAVHIGSSPIGYALPLAVFGFALCLVYQWTGSLYPCIALHALNNGFALGVDQEWGWEIPLVMVLAVAVSLSLAALLGRALTRRADAAVGPLPAPAA